MTSPWVQQRTPSSCSSSNALRPAPSARRRSSSTSRPREQVRRALGGLPANLVDLGLRREAPLQGTHPPVADDLRPALAVGVARLAELLEELAAEPGLLLDLAQRTRLVGFTGVALALREAPVVVLGPVHEQHLPLSHDEPAGGADDGQSVLRSFFHAFGQASRASSRRSCSRSTRRPATRACSGADPAASSRNRSAATTAS